MAGSSKVDDSALRSLCESIVREVRCREEGKSLDDPISAGLIANIQSRIGSWVVSQLGLCSVMDYTSTSQGELLRHKSLNS